MIFYVDYIVTVCVIKDVGVYSVSIYFRKSNFSFWYCNFQIELFFSWYTLQLNLLFIAQI